MIKLLNKILKRFNLQLVYTKPDTSLVKETVKFMNDNPKYFDGYTIPGSTYIGDINYIKDKNGKTKMNWVYGEEGKTPTKLYAGKITNNVTQAVARIVMTDGMLRVAKKYHIAGTVHDELIAVVPQAEAAEAKTWVLAQMTMEPKYMPGIPLDADGGHHRRYGLAKN